MLLLFGRSTSPVIIMPLFRSYFIFCFSLGSKVSSSACIFSYVSRASIPHGKLRGALHYAYRKLKQLLLCFFTRVYSLRRTVLHRSTGVAASCSGYASEHDTNFGYMDLGVKRMEDINTASSGEDLVDGWVEDEASFLLLLLLMDATVIIRPQSPLSSAVCWIKGLSCRKERADGLRSRMFACLPAMGC